MSHLNDFPTTVILPGPMPIWEVFSPPKELYVKGKPEALALLERLPEAGLAIVGTRDPQARSLELIEKIVSGLRRTGIIIISGLARGIDAHAHRCALKAGLPTIAVLGTGLDTAYPASTWDLRLRILEAGGLVVSEFPGGSSGRGFQFLLRNRIIAGWSKATWVVEAGFRSGALNTARWARDQNRMCFTVPCFPGDPALLGNQTLLDRDHALPLWDVHSLGAAWIDLATSTSKPQQEEIPSLRESESDLRIHALKREILSRTYQRGGVPIHELQNWALTHQWSSIEFFGAMQRAITLGLITEQKGILLCLKG